MWCPAKARPPHGSELLPAPATPMGKQTKPLEVGSREKQSFTHLAQQENDLQVCTWHNFRVFALGQPLWSSSFWAGFLPGGKEGLRKPFPKRVTNLLLHSMQGCFSLTQPIPSLFISSLIGQGGFWGLYFFLKVWSGTPVILPHVLSGNVGFGEWIATFSLCQKLLQGANLIHAAPKAQTCHGFESFPLSKLGMTDCRSCWCGCTTLHGQGTSPALSLSPPSHRNVSL